MRRIDQLSGNAARFAHYCVKQGSMSVMIDEMRQGADAKLCQRWGLTAEEWQDAIFAALEVLRNKHE